MKRLLLCILLATAGGPASAQKSSQVLTHESASKMRDGCLAYARGKDLAVVIAVHDEAGSLVLFERSDGTSPAVSDIAIWKSRSAAIYRSPGSATATWNLPTLPGLATVAGGVPIFTTDGQALGGIGVSGAKVDEDVACAEAGIRLAGLKSVKSK